MIKRLISAIFSRLGMIEPMYFLATASQVVGIGAGLSSMFGGGGGGPGGGSGSSPPVYVPSYLSPADTAFWNTTSGNLGTANTASGLSLPSIYNYLATSMNPALTAPLTASVPSAMAAYNPIIYSGSTYGDTLKSLADSNIRQMTDVTNAGKTLWNMGLDPQNALYNRTAQQLQDQVRAANSAAGVSTSPYGAGLEGQAMSNFNIDWQNNLLNRANTGLGGYLNAISASQRGNQLTGADLTGSLDFYSGVPGAITSKAGVPLSIQQQIGGATNTDIANYLALMGGNIGLSQNVAQGLIPYMNYGTGAGYNAASVAQGNRDFSANQQYAGANTLISAMNNWGQPGNPLGSWLSGMNSPGGVYDPAAASNWQYPNVSPGYYDYGGGASYPALPSG